MHIDQKEIEESIVIEMLLKKGAGGVTMFDFDDGEMFTDVELEAIILRLKNKIEVKH